MLMAFVAILTGFISLVWSANRFVEGAAVTSKYSGMPPLLIGMVVVGFGTSAPEMIVSAIAAFDDNPDLALGNALGSNIVNIGLILGVTALISPIIVNSDIIRKELPIFLGVGVIAGAFFWDGALEAVESMLLLFTFFILIGWTIVVALKSQGDSLEKELLQDMNQQTMSLGRAIMWLLVGLMLLIISSRVLVWGAVSMAESMGVSDLIIGLTIVALGTSLPELAASVIAARKGEHDLAIGNVIGSNMFNVLAVVGIAGVISPMSQIAPDVITRDWIVMMLMTGILLVMAYGVKGQGRINRMEGGLLLVSFVAYNLWLVLSVMA